jgi:hypothetical protein
MVPLFVVATAVHLGIRWTERENPQALQVSPLHSGESIGVTVLPAAAEAVPSEHCLQLIVFSPDCPFCQHAADRESQTLSEDSRARRIWYTEKETASLPQFIAEHLRRQPAISAELVKALKIQAVPALFVLSPEGEIRWVGGYHGDEPDQELAARCTGATNPTQKT